MRSKTLTLGGCAVRQFLRLPTFVGLLVVLPVAFVLVTMETTAEASLPVYTYVDGLRTGLVVPIPELHGTVIAAVTVALLTGIAGLLLSSAAVDTDGRLRLAGYGPLELFGGRLGAVALVAAVATATVAGTPVRDGPGRTPSRRGPYRDYRLSLVSPHESELHRDPLGVLALPRCRRGTRRPGDDASRAHARTPRDPQREQTGRDVVSALAAHSRWRVERHGDELRDGAPVATGRRGGLR